MIGSGYFSPHAPGLFQPIIDSLLEQGDYDIVLADYAAYLACQEKAGLEYQDQTRWTAKAIINTANMGKFSSDRTIKQYAEEIWGAKPVAITI
jgi:starch phosphorylase